MSDSFEGFVVSLNVFPPFGFFASSGFGILASGLLLPGSWASSFFTVLNLLSDRNPIIIRFGFFERYPNALPLVYNIILIDCRIAMFIESCNILETRAEILKYWWR